MFPLRSSSPLRPSLPLNALRTIVALQAWQSCGAGCTRRARRPLNTLGTLSAIGTRCACSAGFSYWPTKSCYPWLTLRPLSASRPHQPHRALFPLRSSRSRWTLNTLITGVAL